MTFQPVLPWAILAVVTGALVLARLVALRQALVSAGRLPGRRSRTALRWSGVTLVVLLLIAATTRPGSRGDENPRATMRSAGTNLNVFLVVDRSVASSAGNDIMTLLKQYPAARYALVDFGSRASLDWPLSQDVWSLQPTIAALSSRYSGPDAGSDDNAAAAANVLRYQLLQAVQQYPGSRNVVLYFGSGAPGSRAPQADFDVTLVDGGAVLGYGRDDAIDEAELRQIAGHLGVPYIHRDPGQPFRLDLPDTAHDTAVETERVELYWLPALLAAMLLLAEIYLSVREFRRGRIARRDLTS
jgi:hypothetical protein